jgi:hypothetical protein
VLLAEVADVLDEELLVDEAAVDEDDVLLAADEVNEPPPAELWLLLVEAPPVDELEGAPPSGPLVTLPPVLTELVLVGVLVGIPPPPLPAPVVYEPPSPSYEEPWAQLAASTAPKPIKRSVRMALPRMAHSLRIRPRLRAASPRLQSSA